MGQKMVKQFPMDCLTLFCPITSCCYLQSDVVPALSVLLPFIENDKSRLTS